MQTFQGRFGRAFLVDSVYVRESNVASSLTKVVFSVNVQVGSPSSRLLITGLHTVADVTCAVCNVIIGWRYVRRSMSESQRLTGLCHIR